MAFEQTLPDPFVSADVDLRDFPFTPFFRSRLFGSDFHAHADDASWRAGVTLWLKSWDQVPAGSLPNDDISLCRLAELGRDLKAWARVREWAMHGWTRCSDGRLYHKVVAEGVNEAWQSKQARRDRTVAAREARQRQREQQAQQEATQHTQPQSVPHSLSQTLPQLPRDKDRDKDRDRDRESSPTVSDETSGVEARVPLKRGTRLPADFEIPDEWVMAAVQARERVKLPPANVELGKETFLNYWPGRTDARGIRKDWRATWINWFLKEPGIKANGRYEVPSQSYSGSDYAGPTEPPPKTSRIAIDGEILFGPNDSG